MALGADRAKTRPVTEALARPLAALGFTPNGLTVIGAALSLLPAYLASQALWLEAGLSLALVSCLDFLDGAVARLKDRVTAFGGYLDSVLDRLSDGVILIGVGLGLNTREGWIVTGAALIAQYLTSYARARSYQDTQPPPQTWNQLFERPERIIYLSTALAAQGIIDRLAPETGVLFWLILIYALLALATTFQRMGRVYELLATTRK